jgi:hypothetical protein
MASPTTLSQAEIDSYSIRRFIESTLAADNWTTVRVFDVADGWPVYEELYVPGVYFQLDGGDTVLVPFELGSHAKRWRVFVNIFGQNDAQRVRLAETIAEMFRDIVPIYDFVTGNEANPDVVDHFETDNAGWRKLISTRNTPDKERWRSLVSVTLRRVAT